MLISSASQNPVYINEWKPGGTPSGVVVIAHGMGEHGGRYEQLAQRLNAQGYVVYAPDHRGHGRTAGSKEKFGHFADRNGWNLVIEDLRAVIDRAHQHHPQLPIILFGHSMGSLLSRRYIQLYGDSIQGVILSGTSGDPGLMGTIGKLIALWEIKRFGPTRHSPLLTKLVVGGFNAKFIPPRTAYDWLSRDPIEVDKYLNDEWVGTTFTTAFYYDLLNGILELHQPTQLHKTPRDLPILLLSGEQDPVGNFSKGAIHTYTRFREIGCNDVIMKLYPDARHETINELNREEVFGDIISWLNNRSHQSHSL